VSEPDAHPDESRLSAMLTLYAVERSDYQAAVQLNLAAIGAGLAYAVPVGALLLSRCQVGRGCEGTGDVVLLLAPLPALGLLGFLLANEALLERRARYLAVVEAELAALVRGREGARRVPYFVRGLLTQVYGPAPPW